MKRNPISLVILLICCGMMNLNAQKKFFTASDYLNRDLSPESINGISWRGGTDAFTYIENNSLIQKLASAPAVADTILSLGMLNSLLRNQKQDELRQFPSISWMDENRFWFRDRSVIYRYDFGNSSLTRVNVYDSRGDNVTIDERSLNAAYTIENNLFIACGGNTIRVTDEENADIVYGYVPSRNEFGINAGMYWSPDGNLLAFYKTDQTEVTDYPLVNIFDRIAKAAPDKYPMAGMKSQKVELGIFSTLQNEIVWLQTQGSENQYITSVTWDPSSEFIYAGILNRDQDHLMVNKYDVHTGKLIKTLFEEKNDRYVEPLHGLHFIGDGASGFIWQSRRDGWNHLYLYDKEGNLVRQLTRGEWEVTNYIGTDPAGSSVWYESTLAGPLERHLCITEVKSGKTRQITSGEGVHGIRASDGRNYFIDVFSGLQMARAYYLIDKKGEVISVLKEDADPYSDYQTGEMSIFSIKADDGKTDLWCRLIKPVGFDASKKYPVLVYVYGGPHAQMITRSWTGGAGFLLNYMAQQGFVVFTLDNRGSANRGFEFESIIHRQLGETEIADQMAGVRYLKSLPYVDTDKIGVDGWSYGGFMSLSLMLRNPGVFRAACAGGPVTDWKWYEVMYGERYMDTPMKNPEGYEKASLLNYAKNLGGDLMIIHGTNDNTVVWQNSLALMDELIKQGKQFDYFVYPGAAHNMAGRARVHLFEKISGFFNENLK
ncbi:MAG TPA: DPP IV N-terminal domain-containing protein [Bacteroidales bacterium]|nr:DPP IV N-terminal domain-containing protein [Bacteroidales bacterium]